MIIVIGIMALLISGGATSFLVQKEVFLMPLMESSKNNDGLQDSPWPMFCHDVRHTGRSQYDTSMNNGEERWKFEAGVITSSPAIDKDGTIYVGSWDCKLYAINPDGTLKWKFETSDTIKSSPAIAKDGTIYVGDKGGFLYAINPDGTEKWRFKTGSWIIASPAIGEDGTIYFGSFDNYVYAVHPNGTEKWSVELHDAAYSPAIGEDGTIYVGSYDNYLYAIDHNGTIKWKFKANEPVAYPSIDKNGIIYIGSWGWAGDNRLYALYSNGTLKWNFKPDFPPYATISCPAIGEDGTIYFGTGEGRLYAVTPEGRKKWSVLLVPRVIDGGIVSSPAIGGDGTIYVGGENGKLYAVYPDGTVKWSSMMLSNNEYIGCILHSSPAIGEDGTIYIGSWFSSEEGFWGYLHAIKDGMAKGIRIIRPKNGYLYIFDREIMEIIIDTFIIGKITIQVSILSEENVDKVEFYIDYDCKYTDYSPPYEWTWWTWKERNPYSRFWVDYNIGAKAYYNDGDVVGSEMKNVIVFNPF